MNPKNSVQPILKLSILLFFVSGMLLYFTGCAQDSDKKTVDSKTTGKDSTKPKPDSIDSRIGIEIVKKDFQSADAKDTKDYNVIVYKLTNKTGKIVKEIAADLTLNDESGNEIRKVKIAFIEPIQPGASKENRALYYCNQFADADMRLKSIDMKNIKYDAYIRSLTYDDGSKEVRK